MNAKQQKILERITNDLNELSQINPDDVIKVDLNIEQRIGE